MPSKVAVQSDRALLERIISNFVGNAIRYTDVGRVLVGCCRHGAFLRIGVYDTGCGIAEEHHQAIFDEFFDRRRSTLRQATALGLGSTSPSGWPTCWAIRSSCKARLAKARALRWKCLSATSGIAALVSQRSTKRLAESLQVLCCLVLEDDNNLRNALTTLLERWEIEVQTFNSFDNIPAGFGRI